ncbi:MAG: hypothetical protein DRQ62_00350 [Gammaproteobacteria bacterium]|nr:MAG: hypothetical protein DRQ62_00350 [Gammaproteobacteria bacterium]
MKIRVTTAYKTEVFSEKEARHIMAFCEEHGIEYETEEIPSIASEVFWGISIGGVISMMI